MDINKMRNIVILKDLPSNLVEEAFVVLKKNQKIRRMQYADNEAENFSDSDRENEDEYVVKEAELVISRYINELESQDLLGKKMNGNLTKKYKNLRIFTTILAIVFIISLFL